MKRCISTLVLLCVMMAGGSAFAESEVDPRPGEPCGEGQVYDCVGSCVSVAEAEGWSGDGYCDDGEWGIVLTCPVFDNDGGDCEAPPLTAPGSPCDDGRLYDCAGNCVEAALASSWVGDGYCDDGSWDLVLTCPAFDYDGGDCGPLSLPQSPVPPEDISGVGGDLQP